GWVINVSISPAGVRIEMIRSCMVSALALIAQLSCAATVAPRLAVADLLGRVARLELPQRLPDRGERNLDPFVQHGLADLRLSQAPRCCSFQDLLNPLCVAPALRAPCPRCARLCTLPRTSPRPAGRRRSSVPSCSSPAGNR